MADGRRHSVDLPISRTLIALRRVRSLRDPSTNSMSKFPALLENVNWESNSTNEILLRFMNGCREGGFDHNVDSKFNSIGVSKQRKENADGFELRNDVKNSMSRLVSCENLGGEDNVDAPVGTAKEDDFEFNNFGLNAEDDHENKPMSKRCCGNHGNEEVDVTCLPPSNKYLEDMDLTNELDVRSPQVERVDQSLRRWKFRSRNQVKPSGMMGDVLSRVGSPCLSLSETLSSRSASLFANDEAGFAAQNDSGCGISCCWTRTPRFRETNSYSDGEGYPLLSRDMADLTPYRQGTWKHINRETPRSLSQKFRPKSFDDLVGQNLVSKSLLGAISRGRIASCYLFHGPRGTGKTSASRVFAAALNCLSLEEYKPCGLCRECVMFFSGRSRDVKEVDSMKINRTERIRSLIKDAAIPPVSSRFKIFIVDECQLLHGETWATLLNSLENFAQHVVFLMITPDLNKLPRSAITHTQRYYFPKIKDADIANRLANICSNEGLDFDHVALEFIASKSNGSLRDAETMLDQLSLFGKKITMTLAYELIGVVSDDELLDLLDLALSSDTSNTVIRARELMSSRIDPMQLVSQLANLIMDILAGKCQEEDSEFRQKFYRRHSSEADLQRLSHALKILSETEKQLRTAKNQCTWLTVALLQLSSLEVSSLDGNISKPSFRHAQDKEGDFCSTSSTGETLKHLNSCACEDNKFHGSGTHGDCKATLAIIWRRATELCQSNSLKNFLRKQGKLASLCFNQDLAVAELVFQHPDYASKAEKSWKLIASSLQSILGCNVEIRINLVLNAPVSKCTKLRKLSFSFFNCSRRMHQRSQSFMGSGSDTDYSDRASEMPMIRDKTILTCNSDCGPQHNCCHKVEVVTALRNGEGNVLSIGTVSSRRSLLGDASKTPGCGVNSVKEEGTKHENEVLSGQETDDRPNCFPRTFRLQKKLWSSGTSPMISTDQQQENKLALSIPRENSFQTCIGTNDPYVLNSNSYTNSSKSEDGLKETSRSLCWRTPTFPTSKAWQLTHQNRRSPVVRWVLPCASAK